MNRVLYIHDSAGASEIDKFFPKGSRDLVINTAEDSDKALEMFNSHTYQCVVCYDRMRTLGATGLLQAMKYRDPSVPFILMSSDQSNESIITAVVNRVDSYLLIDGHGRSAVDVENTVRKVIERQRSEEIQTEKEKHIQNALKAANMVLFEWEKETGIFGLSSMLNRFGYAVVERPLSELEASAFLHPDDFRMIRGMTTAFPIGKEMEFRIRIRDPKGRWRWVELRGEVTESEAGNPSRIIGTFFDITDSMRVEEEIGRHHALLNAIVDNINDAIFVKDVDGRYMILNRGGAKMAGVNASEAIGKFDDFLFGPEAAKVCREEDLGVMGAGEVRNFDTTALIGDRLRTFISTKAPMLDPEGKVIGLIGITRDMTDKKNDELALKESQRKFKSLYDNTFETITIYEMVYDQEGKIVDWILRDNNRAAQIYFGKPLESMYGKKVSELFGLRNMDQFILKSREVMATGHGEMSETYFQWNGRYYMSSMFPIGTNLLATVGLDISDRKGAEEALRRANKKLGLLSGVTRHDMANQLMVVSGIVSLMEMDKDRCSPDHLVKLTRSIAIMKNQLEFMKQYQEIGVMAPEWQNLHHLVEKAVKQLPLGDMEVLEEKTDLSVRADPMFEKVVYNLIENVIRHSDGAKHLHISVAEKDGSISLVFQDDGRGVTSKEREHLFQSGHGKNTGFGLFLSKEILEITGLTITEEDTEGKGAKFSVGVPLGMYRRQVRDHTLPDE